MKYLSAAIVYLFLSAQFSPPKYVTTERSNNYVREGAGSYHKLLHVLPPKIELKILEEKELWIKVELPDKSTGWIAENSLRKTSEESDLKSNLAKTWSTPQASKSGIVAAIKGLQGKSKKTVAGDLDKLMLLIEGDITDKQLAEFKEPLILAESENRGELELDDLDLKEPVYDPDLGEQQIGLGVASRIIEDGVIESDELTTYVNLVMYSLLSQSQFYDWQFNLLILESNTIDGYACPGGFLFITKGAIMSCKNEAELAALIAHEAAHVIQRHGMQEIFERRSHIKMDKAFQELEAETGPEENPEIIALEESMIKSYDKIVSSRLLEYELEADKIAAVLCSNAGYDPFSLSRITGRISMLYEETTDIFDDNYLAPNEMLIRANAINDFNEDEFTLENAGALMKERFLDNTGELR